MKDRYWAGFDDGYRDAAKGRCANIVIQRTWNKQYAQGYIDGHITRWYREGRS